MERLQKFLAGAGIASRRASEQLILAGRVTVNGAVVDQLGARVDPASDRVAVDGRLVNTEGERLYILLNKPAGYVTTAKDPEGRRTVLDLVKDIKQRVYPVGRLDYDTEGLLLLTNDGELTHALTHPSHEVEKTYQARVAGIPAEKQLDRLRQGIQLEDGLTAPARVKLLKAQKQHAWLELTIHEGRNRQVRRMCDAIGFPVIYLARVGMGFLSLEGLPLGSYRLLTAGEVQQLKALAGLGS